MASALALRYWQKPRRSGQHYRVHVLCHSNVDLRACMYVYFPKQNKLLSSGADEIDLQEKSLPLLSTNIPLQDARKQLPLLCPAVLSDRKAHSDMALLGLLGSLGPFGKFTFRWKVNFPLLVPRCVCSFQEESVASIRDKPLRD